ncbi:E3 ubiquitin-protein ligase NEURL3 isoform X2 [Rhinatrema bivittatum]|uniref:E3 ubiquitin-protein ligase NEURL3 isoform X2 n=1 Tax=Rhinatrema bivittatum TaxID=194408 RepID=UPI00112695B8|nr:E3 ubiquitin-protein ligase NEURL3 isoform X2 [Rhinatrema bivittatum]
MTNGGTCCKKTPKPLFFHPFTKGCNIVMDELHGYAERKSSFHNAILFTNRPIRLQEVVALKILKVEEHWNGGVRVGFTSVNPSEIDPLKLPPFVCPNLTVLHGFWAAVIPDEFAQEGMVTQFWVDKKGKVFCSSDERIKVHLLFDGVPVDYPLWAIVDVYGRTKAVQLQDTSRVAQMKRLPPATWSKIPTLPKEAAESVNWKCLLRYGDTEECAICFRAGADAIIYPCSHASICFPCAQTVFQTTAVCPMCRRRMESVRRVPCSSSARARGGQDVSGE